jgi:hypothetical protein
MLRGHITLAAIAITLLGLTSLPARALPAAQPAPASYIGTVHIPLTASPPPIDGNLDNPAWKNAAVVQLTYNLRDHKAAGDKTTDYIMTDGTYVYVGIRAQQGTPVRAQQHTNDVGVDTDDEVQMDLWPNGTAGFRYIFITTALGTHYQFSSENNSYDPTWWSVGKLVPGGYTVTMKIPLNIMHGSGAGTWRVQFARLVMATNDDLVWSYGPSQQNHNDVNYAGTADGLPQVAALRPAPRAGIYALGAIAGPSAGGNTSRAGVDLSVPVGFGTSFVGTFHPDYSNVEIDQQTIAPTAFARIFNDVRPFFTQGANFYNTTPNCPDCPGTQLYTPAIPTPRDGYALEGQHGLFSYAAFDAVGVARDDNAQVVNYASPNQQNLITLQRVSANLSAMQDNTVNASYTHDNLKNFSQWIRYSNDQGTNVLAGDRAQRYETGVNWYTPTSSVAVGLRKIGQYYDPVDGLIFQPDIAGYYVNLSKQLKYASSAPIKEVDVFADLNRFHGHTGGLSQTTNFLQVAMTTRHQLHVAVTTGSFYTRLSDGVFTPATQQGIGITSDYGSATPTSISFNTGRFGPGRLNSWTRSSTIRAGERGSFTLEADDTEQYTDKGERFVQWLERASFSYQMSRDSSLALGVRRIIGIPPEIETPQQFASAWNLSAAFHRKVPGGEVYIVYGDASTFSTVPQFIVKFIKYVGADKGT